MLLVVILQPAEAQPKENDFGIEAAVIVFITHFITKTKMSSLIIGSAFLI